MCNSVLFLLFKEVRFGAFVNQTKTANDQGGGGGGKDLCFAEINLKISFKRIFF